MKRDELILPLSRPKVGVQGTTGSWRIRKPVINYSKCIGCGICWLYCPDSTIDIEDTGSRFRVSIDYTYCKGCGICWTVCPVKAIDMVKEV
ncbi:MAG: 4Fe-4S binding protein [Sulfolobales archaeon]|nr:4Fe-4S binding protein [Sulfolobales archaeon]MDW8083534.1 4Fe-4S binding protein [Sulfolobales archaeon]